MKRLTFGATLMVASLALGACSDGPTQADRSDVDDYALVFFGTSGTALQGSLGPQGGRPFDGRSGAPTLPGELALTDAQKAEIEALRAAFQTEHQSDLDALRGVFEEARDARQEGATREEVHAILEEGRAIAQSLHEDVQALHEAIQGVFTAAQVAWLEAHRPAPPPDLDGRSRPDPRHGPRGGGFPPG